MDGVLVGVLLARYCGGDLGMGQKELDIEG
jgi:hypothetical protein